MSCIVVHGFVPFDRSGRVRWLLTEMGRSHEFRRLDYGAGESKTEAFRALSPCGKIPVIQDQGVTLFETGACLLYLADRYGKGEYGPGPEDPGRGEFLSWLFLATATLDPVCFEFVRPDLPEEETEPRKGRARKEVVRLLEAVDTRLAGRETLLEGGFSVLDVQVAASLHYADRDGRLVDFPRLSTYLEAMRGRDAALEVGLFGR